MYVRLEDVEVFAALGFAVAAPNLAQQSFDLEAGGGARASVLAPRGTLPQKVLRALGVLQLEPDLRQDAHQQLVHVVVDGHGRLDELAVVRRRQVLALCKNKQTVQQKLKNKLTITNFQIDLSFVSAFLLY